MLSQKETQLVMIQKYLCKINACMPQLDRNALNHLDSFANYIRAELDKVKGFS